MSKPYIINALDIGSSTIKLVSVSKKPGKEEFEIVAWAEEPSLGIRKGVVIDVPKVAQIISSLTKRIEEETGKKVENVYASIGGGHLFSTSSRGLVSVSRADRKISEEDIERVLQAAQTLSLPPNKEVLEVFPKEFIVDGQNGIKEAVGMEGVRLEADVVVLGGFSPYVRNSNKSISSSGLHANYLFPTPLASSKAVLTSKEKELGVCVLDIGFGTTSMSVFEEGSLVHVVVFPIGSGHITNDIAICLKTDIDTAEKIKIEFGSCKEFSSKSSKSEKKITIEGEEQLEFSKKTLADIIEARICEIFDLVNRELKQISRQGQLPAGIVLTGGGAKIPGIREAAKKTIKLPCRIGTPDIFLRHNDTSMATLCGLAMEGAEMEEENHVPGHRKGIKSFFKKVFKIFIP